MPVPVLDAESRLRSLQQTAAAVRERLEHLQPRAAHAISTSQRLTRYTWPVMTTDRRHPLRNHVETLERELEGLRTAMQTRAVIEQAKGMIMLRERCDADAAFSTLVRVSQRSHTKLHDVAVRIVSWGTQPTRGKPNARQTRVTGGEP